MADMSWRKYGLSSLMVLLLVTNIAEGIIILRSSKSNNQDDEKQDPCLMLESELVRRSNILTQDVQNMLDASGLIQKRDGDLFVLVAPNTCRACVETNNALLYDIYSRCREKTVCLLVPRGQLRNYLAYFSGLDNVNIVEYEANLSDYLDIVADGYLYYTLKGNNVKDYHMSGKVFSTASRVFVTRNLE